MPAYFNHSLDSIDRCTYIMAHPPQEIRFRYIGALSLLGCFLQLLHVFTDQPVTKQ